MQNSRGASAGWRSALVRHTKIESTVRYLGIEVDDALAVPGKSTSELPGQS